jgi:prolyl oligopeptidase
MHIRHATLVAALLAAFGAGQAIGQTCAANGTPLTYPVAKKVDQTDDYHGTRVADPYRWLEDANSAETKAWVDAQNQVTQAYLAQIPQREAIRKRLTKLWNYERYSVPYKEGGRYFYSRNDGLQNQSVLYTMKSLSDTPRVLLDPNTLAADGTVALAGTAVSPDGKLLAYGTAASGSDWNESACATSRPARTWTTTSSGSSSRPPGPTTARASSTAATTSRRKRPSWPT